MGITVKSYSRHLNGKLISVHGYAANRNQAGYVTPLADRPITKQFVDRGESMGISPPGTVMSPQDGHDPMPGEGGLTAYMFLPGGHATKQPIVRWRRTILPIKGAYRIPKKR